MPLLAHLEKFNYIMADTENTFEFRQNEIYIAIGLIEGILKYVIFAFILKINREKLRNSVMSTLR